MLLPPRESRIRQVATSCAARARRNQKLVRIRSLIPLIAPLACRIADVEPNLLLNFHVFVCFDAMRLSIRGSPGVPLSTVR